MFSILTYPRRLRRLKFLNMDFEYRRVLIYGGNGALGAKCVSLFKDYGFWIGCIDLAENVEADWTMVVKKEDSFEQQEKAILSKLGATLDRWKFDAILCAAGGWAGGNASKDLAKTAELMWQQSVCTSLITAAIAANYLRDGGMLVLTGAQAALEGTPGMIGYGVAKAAVHQLTKSLAAKESGMPKDALVVAILPVTLDTPMNREGMPEADLSTWTPLEFVAELFRSWVYKENRPQNGSLLQLVTTNFNTEVVPV